MTNKMTAQRVIEEEQFRLVKEYPATIRVYENMAGDALREIVETTQGVIVEEGPGGIALNHLPKNKDEAPSCIAYLDWLESMGSDIMRSYRKNRNYSKLAKTKQEVTA